MFAVVSYKNNQYKFESGKEYTVDFLGENSEKEIIFSKVLLLKKDDKVLIGEPDLANAAVKAEILSVVRGKKVRVFKFRAKKRYKRTAGERVKLSKIKIIEINDKK